jgi:hypothetical protein
VTSISISFVAHDSDDPRRTLARPVRRRRDTEPGTPRALAEGSGIYENAARAARLMVEQQMRPVGTAVQFGGVTLRVERHDGAVAILLPDGTLLLGDDDQASDLVELLLGREPVLLP